MNRPRTTSLMSLALRSALTRAVPAAVLLAVVAGCTSTPAAPGQSSAISAGSTASTTTTGSAGPTESTGSAGPTESTGSAGPTKSTGSAGPTESTGSSAVDPSATDRTTASGGSRSSTAGGSTSGTGSSVDTTGKSGTATDPGSYSGGSATDTAVPTTSLPPAATTKVPAPGSGNINQTVPSVAETTAPSRQLTQTAEFGGKVTAQIVSLKAVTGVANGPGEIAGPALSVTLRVTNGSTKAIVLDGVGVTLTDSTGGPTSTLAGPPSAPFTGTLAAGDDATGSYVFTIAADKRRPIKLSLSYSTEAPTVVFAGNAP